MTESSEKYTFLSHIYGISLRSGTPMIQLHDYTVCNRDYLFEHFPTSKGFFTQKLKATPGQVAAIDYFFIIRTNVSAPDHKTAHEKFVVEIDEFVNAVLYHIPVRRSENRRVSITQESFSNEILSIYNDKIFESLAVLDLLNPLFILDERFFEKPGNNKKIFQYLTKQPPIDIEKRIRTSVSWIGQGLRNPNLSEGFIELVFALETLLTFDEIANAKSITVQLAEDVALLIGDSLNARKEIFAKVKHLYGKRSAIVHPKGKKKIESNDFLLLIRYLKEIVSSLFGLLDSKNVNSGKMLREYIDDLKFEHSGT